jgi:phosphoserine phosphatase
MGIAFRAKPVVRAQARQAISTLGIDAVLYLIGDGQHDVTP